VTASVPVSPSAFFAWCLENATELSFRANYPQYHRMLGKADYLWRSYDRRLTDIIPLAKSGIRALEIGCGIGADLHWLALHGASVVGLDVKSEWIAAARQLTEIVSNHFGPVDVDIRRTNFLDMPDEQFDLVYMKDTFHHLEPRDRIIDKLAKVLKKGGRLVIVEPNAWNPLIQYKMFAIRGFKTIAVKTDKATGERFVYGNERLVTPAALRRGFRSAGIEGQTRVLRLLPTQLSNKPSLARIAEQLERAGVDSWLLPAAIHTVFLGVKTR
jgi:SAM-dependent methyltransferase